MALARIGGVKSSGVGEWHCIESGMFEDCEA